MSGRLKGKVFYNHGATSGIGKAAAILFAAEGSQVVFAGRRKEREKKIEAEIIASGGDATFVQADVLSVSKTFKNC